MKVGFGMYLFAFVLLCSVAPMVRYQDIIVTAFCCYNLLF